ncbi:MAG: hypothetical protein BWY17_03409 [Deltaproteobacteria bacterium ADurb.Bin207]|jgi:hypothetical protein|nr:MAG: hypothetical protein BWY17_03409 [Deltaproteobacteria bacterium ADurb.Bin207]
MTEHRLAGVLRHQLATLRKNNRFASMSISHQTAGHLILKHPDNPGGNTFKHHCRVGNREHNWIVVNASQSVQAR